MRALRCLPVMAPLIMGCDAYLSAGSAYYAADQGQAVTGPVSDASVFVSVEQTSTSPFDPGRADATHLAILTLAGAAPEDLTTTPSSCTYVFPPERAAVRYDFAGRKATTIRAVPKGTGGQAPVDLVWDPSSLRFRGDITPPLAGGDTLEISFAPGGDLLPGQTILATIAARAAPAVTVEASSEGTRISTAPGEGRGELVLAHTGASLARFESRLICPFDLAAPTQLVTADELTLLVNAFESENKGRTSPGSEDSFGPHAITAHVRAPLVRTTVAAGSNRVHVISADDRGEGIVME